jgi:hypothetical protein
MPARAYAGIKKEWKREWIELFLVGGKRWRYHSNSGPDRRWCDRRRRWCLIDRRRRWCVRFSLGRRLDAAARFSPIAIGFSAVTMDAND